MFGKIFNFRFRLTAAIFLVAVCSTVSGLIYYYRMASSQIWTQMTGRMEDFGKLGVTLFTPLDLKYLQELDIKLNTTQAPSATVVKNPGVVFSALSEDERLVIIKKTPYQIIVQKLRRLRAASGKAPAHETFIPANQTGTGNEPQIRRVWLTGVEMHRIAPNYLRVLAADELEEIDRDGNGRIDAHEKLYRLGDIFSGESLSGLAAALRGEITVSEGYRADSSGVFLTGFTPVKNNAGKIIALLIMDFSAASEFDALFRLKVTAYYILVAVLLFSIIVSSAISKFMLAPVENMQKAALRIAQRDFSIRIENTSNDELGDLANAMNVMAHELGEYSSKMERRIAARTQELSSILNALEQGVLTLDNNGIIQSEYSAATLTIFGLKEIAHRRFSELFSDKKTAAAVEQYIALFFSQNEISIAMLEKANPVRKILYRNAQGETHHLRFSFRPLLEHGNQTDRLLVTIVDETQEAILQEKISLAEAAKKSEFDAIINMMRLPTPILADFMAQQKEFLQAGKSIVSTFGNDPSKFSAFASRTHALKGNALQLGFSSLAEKLHELEDYLVQIQRQPTDARFLRFEISRCINECEELILNRDKLVARIRELVGINDRETLSATRQQLRLFWMEQIQRKAAEAGIAVTPTVEFGEGSETVIQKLHNVLVQLVRNTFAHGIESPEERNARSKPKEMQIGIFASKTASGFELIYKEDGRGFASAPTEFVSLDQLTQKGLTAARSSATLEAGRGLGMEYILSNITGLKGSIRIKSSEQETIFRIFLPE